MDINRINRDKVKISFNAEDLDKIGINFDTFKNDRDSAEIFLINLLTIIDELGFFYSQKDNIVVDVTELKDGTMSICFQHEQTDNNKQAEKNDTVICRIFQNADGLIKFCKCINKSIIEQLESQELYLYKDFYAIILTLGYTESDIPENLKQKNKCCNQLLLSKIREYGLLLTDSPIEKITAL